MRTVHVSVGQLIQFMISLCFFFRRRFTILLDERGLDLG